MARPGPYPSGLARFMKWDSADGYTRVFSDAKRRDTQVVRRIGKSGYHHFQHVEKLRLQSPDTSGLENRSGASACGGLPIPIPRAPELAATLEVESRR